MSGEALLSILIFASIGVAQPQISEYGIANAASYGYFGRSDPGVAQGSIIVIFGKGLGPNTLVQAGGFPIPAELAGTKVTLQADGAYLSAPLIYSSTTQVAAIVPS